MPTVLYFAETTASRKGPGTYPTNATQYANIAPDSTVSTEGYMIPYTWRAVANLSQSSKNRTSAQVARFGRFFSAPFATDYTYTHPTDAGSAIQYFLADYESNLSANHCVQQCFVYVWRPSTGSVVGVIQPVQVLAVGSREPTAANSIRGTLGSYFAAAPGTIQILKGDILVFEPFSTFTQGSASAYTIRFYYGGSTEVVTENTVYNTPASKVVFSVDLPLERSAGSLAGEVKYKAVVEWLGLRMFAGLRVSAKTYSVLSEGGVLSSRSEVRAAIIANLTGQTLLATTLKSVSKSESWLWQEHALSAQLRARSQVLSFFPSRALGESLNLYYSGNGSFLEPERSLGGKKGAAVSGGTFSVTSSVPGVVVQSVHGVAAGSYYVEVDTQLKTVSMGVSGSLPRLVVGYANETVLAAGTADTGFVTVRIATSAVSGVVRFVVTEATVAETLFVPPKPKELQTTHTVYRCLYLFNDTDTEVSGVTLSVFSDTDSVSVASEFVSSISTPGYDRSVQWPRGMAYRASDVTG